ncbi:TPM domain-containing protein, partial [Clostridium botulinum]
MENFFEKYLSRRRLTFVLIMTLIMTFPMLIKAQTNFPQPTSLKYVNDYVGVMDDATRGEIVAIGDELEKKTGAQATVVVINSLGGSDIESYTNNLFRQWGIGQRNKNNGLMILLSVNDRKWRVEVGKGLEGAITDSYSSKVMDNVAKPLLKEGKYGEAIKAAYSTFAGDIGNERNVTLEQNDAIQASQQDSEGISWFGLIMCFIIFIIVIVVIIAAAGSGSNNRGYYGRDRYRRDHWDDDHFHHGG